VSTYVRKRPFEELVTSLKFDSQKLHNGIVLLSTANHIATLGNKLRLERTEASFIALIVFEVCRWRENSFLPAWHAILVISHCKVEQSGRIVKMDPNDDLILSQIADNVESEYNQLTNNHENLELTQVMDLHDSLNQNLDLDDDEFPLTQIYYETEDKSAGYAATFDMQLPDDFDALDVDDVDITSLLSEFF
jgi:hypothetical protein